MKIEIESGVSIIICTFNGRKRILSTINHLQRQETDGVLKWEVIVVDNASTDNTAEFVKEIWITKNVTDLRFIKENNPGVMNARIKGITEAKYEYICFIDDDNWPDKNWVSNIMRTFNMHPEIAGCGGKNIPVFESTTPDWFPIVSHSFACGDQLSNGSGYTETLWGAGLCIRKSAWNYLIKCGFKNHLAGRTRTDLLAGEDSEICLGLRIAGLKLWYNHELTLQHFISNSKLDFNKMLKLTEGLGKSEVVLRIYRSMLDDTIRVRSSWVTEYMATLYYYFKIKVYNWYLTIKGRNSTSSDFHQEQMKNEGLKIITTTIFVKGYLKKLLSIRTNYRSIQKEIRTLSDNLKMADL